MSRLVLALLLTTLISSALDAQAFRPRGQSSFATDLPDTQNSIREQRDVQAVDAPGQKAATVSQDLLQVYTQTKSAKSETDLTSIARACAKALSDSSRSQADQEYASSLLAWSLNRRGELRSEQAASLVEAGKVESAGKLDSQAADDFATAVKYAPNHWRHRHNYAVSLAMRGDYTGAIAQFDEAIRMNPQYANARFNRAELYFEMGDPQAADQDYTAAIELSDDAQYYNNRAHCRFLMEAYPQAISDYRHAVELASDNAVFQTDLADAYQFLGRWEEAAKSYRAAVAADNRYARAYQNAAWLMATCPRDHIRNTELAISAAKRAMELTGHRTMETVETLAVATAALGKHAEAAELQQEALKLARESSTKLPEAQQTEMSQRLTLYSNGQAYVQPQPDQASPPPIVTRTVSATGK